MVTVQLKAIVHCCIIDLDIAILYLYSYAPWRIAIDTFWPVSRCRQLMLELIDQSLIEVKEMVVLST